MVSRRAMRELPLLPFVWLTSGITAWAGGYAVQVGQPHPEFVLPSITDGRPVALSQFRGRKVLLVHFASW